MPFFSDTEESRPQAMEILAAQAAAAGLIYVSGDEPGIRRLTSGEGFRYIGPDEKPLNDEAELERIARLAIPPAYTDVWICPHPLGHLQATGLDARSRKQYRYHSDWRAVRDSIKFDRMVEFGEALPRLRERVHLDLKKRGLPRKKVVAAIVRLLDTTQVRIGNLSYARDNHSFGLTTLRKRHLAFINSRRASLKFRGKSGIEHEVTIGDRCIVSIIRTCQELRGQHLFQYLDESGKRRPVGAEQVNAYLHEVMEAEFTAKDFRTWSGTLRAFEIMLNTPLPEFPTKRALKAGIVAAIRQVAEDLRNTPAVCRKSYINPAVFSAWQKGDLHRRLPEPEETAHPMHDSLESAVLSFLRKQKAG
jgi:DNA topoisomerase I